jgi:hypothetical protein
LTFSIVGQAKFDGILGLAFPILSQDPDAKTVLQNLVDQQIIENGMFGFFLGNVRVMSVLVDMRFS